MKLILLLLIQVILSNAFLPSLRSKASTRLSVQMSSEYKSIQKKVVTFLSVAIISFGISSHGISSANADDIPVVPLYTKKSADLQVYSDIGRGFKMLRPFGYNEFDGAGQGYAMKFASLVNIDENVVVGSTPATAGKTSIVDYGTIESLGQKLAGILTFAKYNNQ